MVRWLRQEATPGARRSGATALCIAMAVVVGTAGCDALSLPHPFAKTPQVSPIKVGLLHSQTGTMAMSETPLRDAEQHLKDRGIVQKGDVYAITCGEPMGAPGGTNMLKICQVE